MESAIDLMSEGVLLIFVTLRYRGRDKGNRYA